MDLILPTKSEISVLSTEELKQHFVQSLEFTAKHLVHLGQLWLELENRGEDLSELKKGIAIYIPMIAHDRIDARLVINYAGQRGLLQALSGLSKQKQQRFIEHPYVDVVTDESGGLSVTEVNLADLSAKQVHQVFTDDNVRLADEQSKLLINARKREKTKTIRKRKVIINQETKTIKLGDEVVYISDILQSLAEYSERTESELIEFIGVDIEPKNKTKNKRKLSSLTHEEKEEIKSMLQSNISQTIISNKFNIEQVELSVIKRFLQ